jgi:hypothetical protein
MKFFEKKYIRSVGLVLPYTSERRTSERLVCLMECLELTDQEVGVLLSITPSQETEKPSNISSMNPKPVFWSFNSSRSKHYTSKDFSIGKPKKPLQPLKRSFYAPILKKQKVLLRKTINTVPRKEEWMDPGNSEFALPMENGMTFLPSKKTLMRERPSSKSPKTTSRRLSDTIGPFASISSSIPQCEIGKWSWKSLLDPQELANLDRCSKRTLEPTGSPRIQDNNNSGMDTLGSQQSSLMITTGGFPMTTSLGSSTDIPSHWILSMERYSALQERFSSPQTNIQENGIITNGWESLLGELYSQMECHATLWSGG